MKQEVIVLLVLLFQLVVCAKSKSSAEYFIDGIYANYLDEKSIFVYNGPAADTIFSPSLLSLIRLDQKIAEGEVGFLDADPLCGCQDDRGIKIQSTMVDVTDTLAYSKISITFPTMSKTLILKLVTANRRWRIDDIIDSSITIPSLKEFLEKSLFHEKLKGNQKSENHKEDSMQNYLLGIWGRNPEENAFFKITKDSIYYVDND